MVLSAITVVGILSIMGSDGNSGPDTQPPSEEKGAFFLRYDHAHDSNADDVGGAKMKYDIPIVWEGWRQLGEEPQTAADHFIIETIENEYPGDPWDGGAQATSLNPGNWKLSVIVNKGLPMECQGIALTSESNVSVTFRVSKETGEFTECTQP